MIRKKPEPMIWIPQSKGTPLASLPEAERPAERLRQLGEASLTDAELLSLLLRETEEGDCEALAERFLKQLAYPRGLLSYRPDTSRARKLGAEAAATVLAAMELGDRLWAPGGGKGYISGDARLVDQVAARFGNAEEQVFGAILIGPEYRQIGIFEICRQAGALREFDPRPLLREALRLRAESLVLFCCRPAGIPVPAVEDRRLVDFALGTLGPLDLELRSYLVVAGKGNFHAAWRNKSA